MYASAIAVHITETVSGLRNRMINSIVRLLTRKCCLTHLATMLVTRILPKRFFRNPMTIDPTTNRIAHIIIQAAKDILKALDVDVLQDKRLVVVFFILDQIFPPALKASGNPMAAAAPAPQTDALSESEQAQVSKLLEAIS